MTEVNRLQGYGEENHERLLQQLRQRDSELDFMREIDPGEGDGVPFVVKDQICTEGTATSAGSEMLEDYRPVFDATAVERLKEAGCRFLGKTHQDEFGFGTFCTNCAFTTPRNPHDPERVVGGSSGGAAAAVAATDEPIVSLGESTGGSISNPAAYNGVIGVTPTYGRVSRYGLVDYASSMDKIGVIADSVELAAEALEVIAGEDRRDQTTSSRPVPNLSELEPAESPALAVPEQLVELEGISDGVRESFESSVEALKDSGAEVEMVDAPALSADVALPAYYVIAMAEASTNLARYSGMRYGAEGDPSEAEDYGEYFSGIRSDHFGEEAVRRIMLGTYTRMAGYRDRYYLKAAEVRTKVIEEYRRLFGDYDAVLSPTMPTVAPEISEVEEMDRTEVYAMDALTVPPNLAGMPMVSIPDGENDGMPTGLHVVGPQFGEREMLEVALYCRRLVGDG